MSRFCPLLVAVCLFPVGCGTPTATVSGTVTFKGQPLPSGTVLFHGAGGRVEHAVIAEGGRYTIADAPLGPVRITVRSHPVAPIGMPSRGAPPPAAPAELTPTPNEKRDGKYVAIPARYLDPGQSDLTYTVHAGTQTHDIALQP